MKDVHIEIKDLTKSFKEVTALDNVSLDIYRGEFTTFLGPSGCGKTTLLRTLAGLYDVQSGTLSIGGRVVNDVPSHRRNAIMVFQDYALFPHMTIRENIAYGLQIHSLPEREIEERIAKTARFLGIRGLEDRQPGQISGGQQQRVALARALVMEPEVLLLDEPLSNLDAKLRMNIRGELRQLQRRLGITTVYVTHDQAEALALSDRIAVMNDGDVIQVGTPWEVYYRPKTRFVADFVGTANLIDASVIDSSGTLTRTQAGGTELYVEELNVEAAPGEAVTMCIRPETLRISSSPIDAETNRIKGTVENHIFEGSYVRYWVKTESGFVIVVDSFDPSQAGVVSGEVEIWVDPQKVHMIRALPWQ